LIVWKFIDDVKALPQDKLKGYFDEDTPLWVRAIGNAELATGFLLNVNKFDILATQLEFIVVKRPKSN